MATKERIVIRLIKVPDRADKISLLIKYKLKDWFFATENSMKGADLEVKDFFKFLIFFEINEAIIYK